MGFDSDFTQISAEKNGEWSLWGVCVLGIDMARHKAKIRFFHFGKPSKLGKPVESSFLVEI